MTASILQVVAAARAHGGRFMKPMRFEIRAGTHIGIIGPNGAGKTTLLRALAGLTEEAHLQVLLCGVALEDLSRREIARRMAYLSQIDLPDPGFSVRDFIALARVAVPRSTDEDLADAAALFNVTHLCARRLATLSGGERQRVMLARCMAQRPQILLLDEPTNHLDIAARLNILDQLRNLPITVISVLHDLSLVHRFADRVLLLAQGALIADGPPDAIFDSKHFTEAFNLRVQRARLINGEESLVFLP